MKSDKNGYAGYAVPVKMIDELPEFVRMLNCDAYEYVYGKQYIVKCILDHQLVSRDENSKGHLISNYLRFEKLLANKRN